MFKFKSLFLTPVARQTRLAKKLRRLIHQRNYWRNRTKDLRRYRRK